jgi:hypothetical protein
MHADTDGLCTASGGRAPGVTWIAVRRGAARRLLSEPRGILWQLTIYFETMLAFVE